MDQDAETARSWTFRLARARASVRDHDSRRDHGGSGMTLSRRGVLAVGGAVGALAATAAGSG
ncbi:hypothetical protein, partial [Streptomyces sp. SID3915]|uniref:hypothetical protein n=1 Tax=Streptomyces sp. SID3915 TaxID=2690263 RepID=UPI001417B1EA